jgi:hypothetical protein
LTYVVGLTSNNVLVIVLVGGTVPSLSPESVAGAADGVDSAWISEVTRPVKAAVSSYGTVVVVDAVIMFVTHVGTLVISRPVHPSIKIEVVFE